MIMEVKRWVVITFVLGGKWFSAVALGLRAAAWGGCRMESVAAPPVVQQPSSPLADQRREEAVIEDTTERTSKSRPMLAREGRCSDVCGGGGH